MCIRDRLYPINRATTKKILQIVIQQYIPELGAPRSIITDHGTQFRGRVWKETLLDLGVKTYKTSVYHPNSNPVERVLREVGRIPVSYTHLDVYKRQALSAWEPHTHTELYMSKNRRPFTSGLNQRQAMDCSSNLRVCLYLYMCCYFCILLYKRDVA